MALAGALLSANASARPSSPGWRCRVRCGCCSAATGPAAGAIPLGRGLGLGTGFCYAAYNLGLKRTQSEAGCDAPGAASTRTGAVHRSVRHCAVAGRDGPRRRRPFAIPGLRTLLILLALAGIGHCLAWSLISRAMAKLPVTLIGLLLLLQPLVAFLLDVLVLHHQAQAREWLGLGLALAGIFVAGMKRRPIPEPIA